MVAKCFLYFQRQIMQYYIIHYYMNLSIFGTSFLLFFLPSINIQGQGQKPIWDSGYLVLTGRSSKMCAVKSYAGLDRWTDRRNGQAVKGYNGSQPASAQLFLFRSVTFAAFGFSFGLAKYLSQHRTILHAYLHQMHLSTFKRVFAVTLYWNLAGFLMLFIQ